MSHPLTSAKPNIKVQSELVSLRKKKVKEQKGGKKRSSSHLIKDRYPLDDIGTQQRPRGGRSNNLEGPVEPLPSPQFHPPCTQDAGTSSHLIKGCYGLGDIGTQQRPRTSVGLSLSEQGRWKVQKCGGHSDNVYCLFLLSFLYQQKW